MTRRADLAALALIALATVRIAMTWTVFSATADEPMHVSAGLQLVRHGQYTYHPLNPPLPRAILGLAPALGGMDFDAARPVPEQLTRVFHSRGRYAHNLVLARAGNLVFFWLAALAAWLWARRELGAAGGLIAMLLFTTQPMILGHSGLATLDMAMTAGVAVSLLAFSRWLEQPDAARAIAFGAAFGFAIACKLPCAVYVPAACLAIWLFRRHGRWTILLALPAAAFTLLLAYGFQLDWLITAVRESLAVDRQATFTYLFGRGGFTGWWWYFPAAVGLKTTLASLLLALIAAIAPRDREALAAAAAILLVSMPTPLNVGVRYVLPVYVPLTIAAAAAVLALWQRRRIVAVALLAWHTAASALAGHDHFSYFNELAARRPWLYLIDSNLDWGQDVLRLRDVVREKKIDHLGTRILGWHDLDALGFPPHYALQHTVPTQGWVAVSEHYWSSVGGIPWLKGRQYERVGKSIRLYYIP